MVRFETKVLATDENVSNSAKLSGTWIKRVCDRRRPGMWFSERTPALARPIGPAGHGLQQALRLSLLSPAILV
jgi:hypothetical protein